MRRLALSLASRVTSCQQCTVKQLQCYQLYPHTYSTQPYRLSHTDTKPSQPSMSQSRRYSTEPPRQPLLLSDFPLIMRPGILKSFRGLLIRYFIIRPYFDTEFDIKTFVAGAKGAIVVISNLLSCGKFDELASMVSPECLRELQAYFNKLSEDQKKTIAVTESEVNLLMPYETGIIMNDPKDNTKRKVEITIIGYARLDLEKELNDLMLNRISPDTRAMLLNYRFIRDYSKGVDDCWTVNVANQALLTDVFHAQQ